MISISSVASGLIDHLGLTGIGVGIGLNGIGVPGISEVLLPLSGVAARQGHQPLIGVLVVAFVGQLIGLSVAYVIGRYGGVALLERYGRYILISPKELHHAQKTFDRHGRPLVFAGAFIPGIQSFIGYIAGIAELGFGEFIVYASIGKVIWIGGLVGLGYELGGHTEAIDKLISRAGLLVFVVLVGAIIWYIRRQTRVSNDATRN